ncbi:MAG: hypothetical protein KJ749_09090, partial [Planctomycetes bacterium]|nr:hypothetical protein [Planctomycetota bacterium]
GSYRADNLESPSPGQTATVVAQEEDEVDVSSSAASPGRYVVQGGTARFEFDREGLASLGLAFVARGAVEERADGGEVSFNIEPSSTLTLATAKGALHKVLGGTIQTSGAFLVDKPSGPRVVIGNLAISVDRAGEYTVKSTLDEELGEYVAFELTEVMLDFVPLTQEVQITGGLFVREAWALEAGIPQAGGVEVGVLRIAGQAIPAETVVAPAEVIEPRVASGTCGGGVAEVDGSDVIVADLQSVLHYGNVGDIHAYAVGTHACNIGTERASWVASTNQHPGILQNMYRLKDDRFEQIGMSWFKHGFYAVSWKLCGPCPVATDGSALGVDCSDPYSASLNGVQGNMSRRSDANAFTGYFPYPWTAPAPDPLIGRRLQVHVDDLAEDLNPGAEYFVQGHYVHPDDSAAGTDENNASYRPVTIAYEAEPEAVPPIKMYDVFPEGQTQREQPAVRAWQDTDLDVVETDVRVPSEGLFILAAKAKDLGTGTYRYSYALQNLNSDRSAGSFSVPLPEGAVVSNIGFHDVDYHSGEIYDSTDWPGVVADGAITWATENYDTNPNANALRFSTLYNFYFDANVEPALTGVIVGLFKPGYPEELAAASLGPKLALIDCNRNTVADQCDVSCEAAGCEWPCGNSVDCNSNGVPDECERDCNDNGIADECDIINCNGALWCADCNSNTTPDGCETDCDGNGIPDDCLPPPDSDNDGVNDCEDLCPYTTPVASCACPPFGDCCWPAYSYCIHNYAPLACVEAGGVPECLAHPCLQGCWLGDSDEDGDLDLRDFAVMQSAFSGFAGHPGYIEPPQESWLVFDYDDDQDIDLLDVKTFVTLIDGP